MTVQGQLDLPGLTVELEGLFAPSWKDGLLNGGKELGLSPGRTCPLVITFRPGMILVPPLC